MTSHQQQQFEVCPDLVPTHPKLLHYLKEVHRKYPFLQPARDMSKDASLIGWSLKGHNQHGFELTVNLFLPNVNRVHFIGTTTGPESYSLNAYLASLGRDEQAKIEQLVTWQFMVGVIELARATIDGVPEALYPAVDSRMKVYRDDDKIMEDDDDDNYVDCTTYKRPGDMDIDEYNDVDDAPEVILERIRSRRYVKGGPPRRKPPSPQPFPNDLFDSANSHHFFSEIIDDDNDNDSMLQ